MGVEELIESAKAMGLDGICLTEHDNFWSVDEVTALSRKHDFLVVPGCEINTDTGHVLVFGLDQYEFGLHKPSFLHSVVERKGAAVVAAHPYRRRFLEDPGRKPEARAETGGSDAHRLEQLGSAATRFQCPIDGLDDLIRELRAGRVQAVDLRNGH